MSHPAAPASPNFDFLARYDRTLVAVAVMAEQYFAQDPVTCLMKARLLATQEELARVQTASAAQPAAAIQLLTSAAQAAAAAIDLDEQATRALIDSRLRARG